MRIELTGRCPLRRRELRVEPVDRGRLVLDARELTFACPLELTAIVTLARSAGDRKIVLITPRDGGVTSYLERMNVLSLLPEGAVIDGELPFGDRKNLSDRLLEVVHLAGQDAADDVVVRLGRMIRTHFGPDLRVLVFQAVGELIDNAVSHGTGPLGAFAAAQFYTGRTSGRQGLEFAVCDTGVGVLSHLGRNVRHRDLSTAEAALLRALERGVTGTEEERGNGLADLWRVTRHGGVTRLVLRSGDAVASVVANRDERRCSGLTVETRVCGTWAWLRVTSPR